jgi:uncharacterized protein
MKRKQIKNRIVIALLLTVFAFSVHAQEYVSLTQAVDTGKAPGVKLRLLSKAGQTRNYVLIFSPGDEVRSGLNDFARKYHVKSAHYTAIGDVFSAKVGFFDYERKMFRAIPVDTSEIASFIGNIALYNGNPVSHTHVSVASKDGSVKGGHLLELIVGPTLEVFITVEPTPLYKKVDKRFDAGIIDPSLEK